MHAHETFTPPPAPHPATRPAQVACAAAFAAALFLAAGVIVLTLAGADPADITALRVVTAALTGVATAAGGAALLLGRPR